MDYTFQYQQLSQLFSLGKENIKIPETNFRIRNLEFKSNFKMHENKADGHSAEYSYEDAQISENWNFKYPVFVPSENKNSRAIILLHGLNERDWTKYLPWAKYLAEKTGRSIILFQLAFHINRGKKEWSDPRQMNDLVNTRKNCNENIVQLSFANAALSNRLSEDPMRFYRAGLQSAHDLLSLISQIKNGEHPLFEKNTHINFIGYSIGAFLTQILFMANPNHILKESKNFLFCGGTTFNHMYGTSKLIMDNLAYEDLNDFYLNQFEKKNRYNKKERNFKSTAISNICF
jgi:pimeloyl-ACP methyl ester carboxylesterase